jgi:response regulator NasT
MKTVAVAEDEPITRMNLIEMLQELGYSVKAEASDGFDAVQACRKYHPDVVLMDIRMPVFDGLTAAGTILKEQLAGCVVMLTAFSDAELVEKATQIGVTGYLVKPVEQRLLRPTIEVAYTQRQRLLESMEQTRQAVEKIEQSKLIRRAQSKLAEMMNISEKDAYAKMRTMAMNKRISVYQAALAIVGDEDGQNVIQQAKQLLMNRKKCSESTAYKTITDYAAANKCSANQAAEAIIKNIAGKNR